MNGQLQHLFLGIGETAFAVGALSIAAGVSLTAFMRLLDPNHWGLWVSPRILVLGRVDDLEAAQW